MKCGHDAAYLRRRINAEDVAEHYCLACVPEDELTAKGRASKRRTANGLINERQRRDAS